MRHDRWIVHTNTEPYQNRYDLIRQIAERIQNANTNNADRAYSAADLQQDTKR